MQCLFATEDGAKLYQPKEREERCSISRDCIRPIMRDMCMATMLFTENEERPGWEWTFDRKGPDEGPSHRSCVHMVHVVDVPYPCRSTFAPTGVDPKTPERQHLEADLFRYTCWTPEDITAPVHEHPVFCMHHIHTV